jgi:hypothetical protein
LEFDHVLFSNSGAYLMKYRKNITLMSLRALAEAVVDPPPERRKHDTLLAETRIERDPSGREIARTVGVRVAAQTPIDRYLSQGHISPDQWWGGDEIRSV